MHKKNIIKAGRKLNKDTRVLIMVHGRGGSAEDILSLASYLDVKEFALLAPQATGGSWYPLSFLAPPEKNEPWLSSALAILKDIVEELRNDGIRDSNIYFLGFSQGACLTLEFVTRFAARYGGVVAFTGGLIGDKIYSENYKGSFEGTPIFIGTSDPDPHVPVERVKESTKLLQSMNGSVIEKIYKNMGHTISADEISNANKLLYGESPKDREFEERKTKSKDM